MKLTQIGDIKVVGGRRYEVMAIAPSYDRAQSDAGILRRHGYVARIKREDYPKRLAKAEKWPARYLVCARKK